MTRRVTPLLAVCSLLLISNPLRAQATFFNSNGVKIYYTEQGRGEPVVLVHGFAVNDMLQWSIPGVTRNLAADYRVITMNCRGHGRSGKPHDVKMYGMEMVEDIVRLLDHLKIKKAHVVGYSMGGFITLRLAIAHPDRLLSATTGGAGWERKVDVEFLNNLADDLDQGKGIGLLINRLTPRGQPKATGDRIKSVNDMLLSLNDAKALAAVMRALKNLAVTEDQLKAVKVPTLAIVGEFDPLRDGVDELKGRLSDLEVVVIAGGDHMDAFLRPEFIRSLKAFLARHSESGRAKLNGALPLGR
jgi:pimeloyl-ACP methyl ester carboxylesterase